MTSLLTSEASRRGHPHSMQGWANRGAGMAVLQIMTQTDSRYLVGPSPSIPGHVRIARLGARPVRGTLGPPSFATDVAAAELVVDGGELRLRWTEDEATVRTSPIEEVSTWTAPDVETTPV